MSLDLTITLSRFDIRWHACRFSGTTSWPVNDKSYILFPSEHCREYLGPWGLIPGVLFCDTVRYSLTAFFSDWTLWEYNREFHFLVRTKSDLCYSYFFEKVSNLSVSSLSRSVISENLTSSSMSSSLLRFSIWRLVKNHFSQDIKKFKKIIKELRAKNNFKDDDLHSTTACFDCIILFLLK